MRHMQKSKLWPKQKIVLDSIIGLHDSIIKKYEEDNLESFPSPKRVKEFVGSPEDMKRLSAIASNNSWDNLFLQVVEDGFGSGYISGNLNNIIIRLLANKDMRRYKEYMQPYALSQRYGAAKIELLKEFYPGKQKQKSVRKFERRMENNINLELEKKV